MSNHPSTSGSIQTSPDRDSGYIFICASDQLREGECKKINVMFRNEADSILVLRTADGVRAYRNRCVHMPRALDCESQQVFDRETGFLRCSMHGIVYSPESGESQSEICRGKKLTAVRWVEIDRRLYLKDRRIKAV